MWLRSNAAYCELKSTEDLQSDKEKTVSHSQVMAELGLKMKAPRK